MRIGENVTHRADGRWEARYIKGRKTSGGAIYGFCYGRTREEAIQKRNDAELIAKNSVIDTPKTFGDIYGMTSGINDDETVRIADEHILPQLGATPITAISDSDLALILQGIKRKSSVTDVKKAVGLLKNVFDYAVSEDYLLESPVSEMTLKYKSGRKSIVTKGFLPITEDEYLTNEQAKALETILLNGVDSRNPGVYIGLYLCLQLGLQRNEVGTLQLKDIDFTHGTLSVNKTPPNQLVNAEDIPGHEPDSTEKRVIPLPKYILNFLYYISPHNLLPNACLVCNKSGTQCTDKDYARELKTINSDSGINTKITINTLRDTFIVRCIKNGLDIFTIAEITGIQNIADLQSRYGELFTTKTYKLCSFESYSSGTRLEHDEPEKLNLMILGAGGYGHTVKEIAEKIGVFNKISFLDDDVTKPEALDTCANFIRYKSEYPCAFPALGDCKRRKWWLDQLTKNGVIVPRIIDPAASVSPSAIIADAVVIEANATINAQATIGRGCIIGSNALIDRGAFLSEAIHADSASTITKDSFVPPLTKIESGTVYSNHIS